MAINVCNYSKFYIFYLIIKNNLLFKAPLMGNAALGQRSDSPAAISKSTPSISMTMAPNNNGTLDFSSELSKHLTLKRQKQKQQEQASITITRTTITTHINATEANLKTNRGPPPQPPTLPLKNLTTVGEDFT